MTDQVTTLTEIMGYDTSTMSAERLAALNVLVSGKVPTHAVVKRPGRGGKKFSYVKHSYVNDLLRDAFGYLWGYEVLEVQAYDDHSASARVRLTMYIPQGDGQYLEVPTTAVGAHEDVTGKMCKAFMVASAASRGLCKAAMRRFGVGREFYGDSVTLSPAGAWATLKEYGSRLGVGEKTIVAEMERLGITSATLVDRFQEAYDAVAELAKRTGPVKPDELLDAARGLGAEVIQEEPAPFDDDPIGSDGPTKDPRSPEQDVDVGDLLPGRQAAQHNFEVLYKWCTDEAGLRSSNDARAIWDEVCGKGAWLSHGDETLREIVTAYLAARTDDEKEALKEHYVC